MATQTLPPESEQDPQVVNLENSRVDSVKAELVRTHQSAMLNVEAGELELSQSMAGQVTAEQISGNQVALLLAQSGETNLTNSAIGVMQANDVHLDGLAGVVVADQVEVENSYSAVVAGNEVRSERIESVILLAGKVEGNVTTLVDTRGAILSSIAVGLAAGMTMLLGNWLFGRRK